MPSLIDANLAYLLVIGAIIFFFLTNLRPKNLALKAGLAACLALAGFELINLVWNPWALPLVALGPLTYMAAQRQPRYERMVGVVTFLLMAGGSAVLFVDQNGSLTINRLLAGVGSVACAQFIWLALRHPDKPGGVRDSEPADSLVGMLGICRVEIEPFATGAVEVEGVTWWARSKSFIAVGSQVRVVRQRGPILTVVLVKQPDKK